MRSLGIEPIVDLCHFGVPDWTGNFQNPDWPPLFAEYAAAFARRYPWVRLYTPVNEIFVRQAEREAPRWLWKEFLNVRLLPSEGAPVLGFTWYSLIDQMDWDVALRDERNMVNPVGLFDLDRRPKPVAATYQLLIRDFAGQLSGKRAENHGTSHAEAGIEGEETAPTVARGHHR